MLICLMYNYVYFRRSEVISPSVPCRSESQGGPVVLYSEVCPTTHTDTPH